MDEIKLARALCKIGLACLALDYGHEYACSSRFDATRRFITEGGEFHNKLLLGTWITMDSSIRMRYEHNHDQLGTIMEFRILGVSIFMNLEEAPQLVVTIPYRKLGFISFRLYGKHRRKRWSLRLIKPRGEGE
jgi:hypothetical protein